MRRRGASPAPRRAAQAHATNGSAHLLPDVAAAKRAGQVAAPGVPVGVGAGGTAVMMAGFAFAYGKHAQSGATWAYRGKGGRAPIALRLEPSASEPRLQPLTPHALSPDARRSTAGAVFIAHNVVPPAVLPASASLNPGVNGTGGGTPAVYGGGTPAASPAAGHQDPSRQVPQYILSATPFFFLLIALEAAVGHGRFSSGGGYELADSHSSITAGAMQLMLDKLVAKAVGVFPYAWLYHNHRLATVPMDGLLPWVLTFVCLDHFYYWFHRGAHEVNLAWASHR